LLALLRQLALAGATHGTVRGQLQAWRLQNRL
jgi:hypothetical protein